MLVWVAWPMAAAGAGLVAFIVAHVRSCPRLVTVTPALPPPPVVQAIPVAEPVAVIPPPRRELEQ